ncbi:MAG: bifunctional riboflavin kinase/FAD synthetase [Bacteroidales bacterium]|nr:bifunctional riboflavin kinase/FAD synthetase [Bacteroidales bacterium]
MKIHYGYEGLSFRSPVVTLGIFDGVHRGHRSLLSTLADRAREAGGESVVITFDPHPRLVLEGSNSGVLLLTSPDEKTALIEQTGADNLVIIGFNESFSTIEACDFLKDILAGKIGTRHLLLGYNHRFGRKGEGDFTTVNECAEPLGFIVEQVQQFHTEEGMISSSSIREALLSGSLDLANRWLGYKYRIGGRVVEGRRLGREIGFPTANIEPAFRHKLIPKDGVYAVEVLLEGHRFAGMMSIGTNPTVNTDNRPRSLEVYIFDFGGDIYGKEITVSFSARLRDEIKFESTARLAMQMKEDMLKALEHFAHK